MNSIIEKIHTENVVADGIKKVIDGTKKLVGCGAPESVTIDEKKHGQAMEDAHEAFHGLLNNNWRQKKEVKSAAQE